MRQIINQLDKLGREKRTGLRPLIIVAQNAIDYIAEWEGELYYTLQEIIRELEVYYGGEMPASSIPPPEPETLIFKGRDERVPFAFIEKALLTGKSVARLRVSRVFDGRYKEGDDAFGTGWIIAPGTVITNYHVIEARNSQFESPATRADLKAQAERLTVWFDYLSERGNFYECQGAVLLADNRELDYALIRLKQADRISDRQPLSIIEHQPELTRGYRLNIVQHSGGGALIYAIRNNFYVGNGNTKDVLRYLTDTEGGSSGSPVFNDYWKVIGLHRAATRIPPEYYVSLPQERYLTLPEETAKGEVITYHNEGIAIHSILDDLSQELHTEIALAQGWN